MEIIIILIIAIILGYVFYRTLLKLKFRKALLFFESGNYDEAIKILNKIFVKHSEAPSKLAECKLKQAQKVKDNNEALKYLNEVVELKKKLTKKTDKTKYDLVVAKVQYEIALIQFNSAMTVANIESEIKNLKDNLHFIDSAIKLSIENEFSVLRLKHLYELAELYFQFGLQCEKAGQLSDAMHNYSIAKDYASESSHPIITFNAVARIGICKLKTNPKEIEFVSLNEHNKADNKYVQDFFYRYIIYLLKRKSYTDAEMILENHFNLPIHIVEQLKELLKTKQVNQAVWIIKEINSTIDQLYEKSFPVDEVRILYENLDVKIKEIEKIVPNLAEKLKKIKPNLFNRLLTYYISQNEFLSCMNLIQQYSSFWESSELLKNLGICCFGITAQGNLTEYNYRIVISNWLTSVFSDKVILKSLESTVWDDNYTFTLADAIGSNYRQYNDIPENVNYEDVSDTNISIGATQKELLQQYEILLQKTISEPSLSKLVYDFYTKEKEAIEKIISLIKNDIIFATPYFAKSHGLSDEIIRLLDNDYFNYRKDEFLEAGIPYLVDNADTYVREYSTARETISKIENAIMNENLNELKSIADDNKRILIERFNTTNDIFEDTIHNAFTKKIQTSGENHKLIPLMEECIRFVNDNDKLKYQCSNFIHDYCISQWKIKPAVILFEMMIKSIEYNPNNYRAAKLITILINNNLMDIVNGKTKSYKKIYSLINEVKLIRSEVLKEALKELLILRKKILSSLGPVMAQTILTSYNLNIQGVILKEVLDTMLELGGGSPSSALLDFILNKLKK